MKKLKVFDSDTLLSGGPGNGTKPCTTTEQVSDPEKMQKWDAFVNVMQRVQQTRVFPYPEEVRAYFEKREMPEAEAIKFFLYFESIGWMQEAKPQSLTGRPVQSGGSITSVHRSAASAATRMIPKPHGLCSTSLMLLFISR